MKGPSLDAIRRFKEQQERKKQEETEKKVQEKLGILEHRANQGDRKAKQELKKIEKIKDQRQVNQQQTNETRKIAAQRTQTSSTDAKIKREKAPPTKNLDFDELMQLAKNNNNEIKKPDPQKEVKKTNPQKIPTESRKTATNRQPSVRPSSHCAPQKDISLDRPKPNPPDRLHSGRALSNRSIVNRPIVNHSSINHSKPSRPAPPYRPPMGPRYNQPRPSSSHMASRYDDYEDEYEDEYDSDDGFVVDEEEEEVQDEVSRTIRSMFRYDKRKCDMREEELDRQYRAIGRVSTFEDLEREERRASRLAAAEDARAEREEEERKRLKRIRLGKQ